MPWSTGRMTSLPVPASVPELSSRARLVSVPGLSLPYQLRISLTRSLIPLASSNTIVCQTQRTRPTKSRAAGSRCPGRRRRRSALAPARLLDELGHEAGPPGLVAGAEAGAVVAVEVLVEQDEVAPVRILLEGPAAAVHGTRAVGAAQEDPGEALGQLGRHVPEVQHAAGAGRALHF